MKHTKILYPLSVLTIASAFLMLSYFWFMMVYPFEILTDTGIEIESQEVSRGEDLVARVSFDKHFNFNTVEVNYFLVDGFVYRLPTNGIQRPVGEQTVVRSFDIPEYAELGEYYLRAEVSYSVFPFREKIRYTWDSNTFRIVE